MVLRYTRIGPVRGDLPPAGVLSDAPGKRLVGPGGARAAPIPAGTVLVELGSGASLKTRLILDAEHNAAYAPIDISPTALEAAVAAIARRLSAP